MGILKVRREFVEKEYQEEQTHFINQGIQFYIVGRVCYHRRLIDLFLVTPILFHHSIEYFIKAYLIREMSLEKIRNFKHNLQKLWKVFKEYIKENELEKFDKFIEQYDKIEKTRYPNEKNIFYKKDISFSMESKFDNFDSQYIEWSIENIDELVYMICQKIESPISVEDWIKTRYYRCEELFINNDFFKKTNETSGPFVISF